MELCLSKAWKMNNPVLLDQIEGLKIIKNICFKKINIFNKIFSEKLSFLPILKLSTTVISAPSFMSFSVR